MKRYFAPFLVFLCISVYSQNLFSQEVPSVQEFGITAGGFTNFPANKNYLKEDQSVFYVAPYVRIGQHEFSAGVVLPLNVQAIYFNDKNIGSRLGALAGYKFYVFDVEGRENMFLHYSFQYLRYKGNYDVNYNDGAEPYHYTETDMYINNVIGLGYNLFLDNNARFGFFYILDYVISQRSHKLGTTAYNENTWATKYIWNNVSTHFGLSFKLTSLKRKVKK